MKFKPLRNTNNKNIQLKSGISLVTFTSISGQILNENEVVKHFQNKEFSSLYINKKFADMWSVVPVLNSKP